MIGIKEREMVILRIVGRQTSTAQLRRAEQVLVQMHHMFPNLEPYRRSFAAAIQKRKEELGK